MPLDVFSRIDPILEESNVPDRHTFFQMGSFILGKECTVQGQLWQAIRELRARRDSLEAMDDQIADLADNIDLVDVRIARLSNPPGFAIDSDPKESEILIRKAKREKAALGRTMDKLKMKSKYLAEEVTYLVGAYETLSKVEKVKPLDDVDAQRTYWNEKLQEELNLRILLKQPIDSEFVRTIMALNDDSPVKAQLTAILQGLQNQMIADRDRNKRAQEQIESIQARGSGER